MELRSPAYPDRVFPGRIDSVGAFLDPQTRVAHARASLDNPDGLLKGEMYVSVEVKEPPDARSNVTLPARAVIYQDGQYYVFVQGTPRKFERRQVTLEREAGADGIGDVVVNGLKPGTPVVSEGSLLINDIMTDEAGGNTAAAQPSVSPIPDNGDPVAAGATPRPL